MPATTSSTPAFFRVLNEIQNAPAKRQEIIKEIQVKTGRALLSYVSSTQHPGSLIELDDSLHIESSLQGGDFSQGLDLLLHSSGGYPEAAEKIIVVCRAYSNDNFRVIVPSYAKSAATIIAMGADCVVMSDSSELGPIDPQFAFNTPQGLVVRAAYSFVKERDELLEDILTSIISGENPLGYIELLRKVDGPFVQECERAIALSEDMALKWLRDYMMRGKPRNKIKAAVKFFADPNLSFSHGRLIGWKQAEAKGLNICHEDKNGELWQLIWELFIRSDMFLKASPRRVKVFETANTALNTEAARSQ